MGEAVTYRMPCNTTGKIDFSVACDEDTEILITFDEFLGENGLIHYRRLYTVNAAMWKLKGGRYRLSTFEPYTLGVMTFHVLKGRAILSDVGMIYFGAENTKRTFRGEDEELKKIFHAAVETYRQNTFTIYMDCPSRERAGWLCDSFFTSRVEKTLTGKSEVERCFLENFFLPDRFENLPEGMFPMCYPADFASGNFIPNWAMFLVLELEEYLERTGDEEFIRNAKDKIYALMNYFKKFENADGLLEKLEKWVFVEWSESNKLTQDINFPTNMLYVKTLRAAARLYHDAEFAEKAERLKMVINEKSFTDKGFYCDNAVYGEDGVARLSGKCTETCQYYAFFCGIATPEEKPELWQRMLHDFGPERIVPNKWPEFTPEAKWKEIYPSNAFIGNYLRLELLYLYGEHEKLIQNIKGFFTKMADLTGTLWENDSTTASCNHGFASHVVYWMDGMGMLSE
jgi:alpha-L-rhamnosidase